MLMDSIHLQLRRYIASNIHTSCCAVLFMFAGLWLNSPVAEPHVMFLFYKKRGQNSTYCRTRAYHYNVGSETGVCFFFLYHNVLF